MFAGIFYVSGLIEKGMRLLPLYIFLSMLWLSCQSEEALLPWRQGAGEEVRTEGADLKQEEDCALATPDMTLYGQLLEAIAPGRQLDLPNDYKSYCGASCRVLPVVWRDFAGREVAKLSSSRFMRYLSSCYDGGIYISMRKLVI